MRPVNIQKRPYTYRCEGIEKYPRDFFILAHKPRHDQYFYHFRKAKEAFFAMSPLISTTGGKQNDFTRDTPSEESELLEVGEDVYIAPLPIEGDEDEYGDLESTNSGEVSSAPLTDVQIAITSEGPEVSHESGNSIKEGTLDKYRLLRKIAVVILLFLVFGFIFNTPLRKLLA